MPEPIHIISLGAGVQSSAMALMAARGEITPMPTCAIFADTQDEPIAVYDWLRKLEKVLPFPVLRVTFGKLSEGILNDWGFSQIPAWMAGKNGHPTLGRRQCTKYYKILPIRREIRKRFPKTKVIVWQGISTDEAHRMKPSGLQWLQHRWPLIELRKNRHECQRYNLRVMGLDAPKSACVYCPYRSNMQWRASRSSLHDRTIIDRVQIVLNPRGEYLTKELKPLDECELAGNISDSQQELFGNECEGMCGV